MLFYFTGTGNCLYVAKKIEEQPISIPQIMKQDQLSFEDETIGIVAPVYGHEVPDMVKDFMRKAKFKTKYFYMILTYGNRHGGASELAYQLCQECGIDVQYINVMIMVDNFLPGFDMNEQMALDKQEDQQIQQIISDIQQRVEKISEVTDTDRQAHQQFLARKAKMPADAFKNLYFVNDQCIACGICTKVCPAGCIRLIDGKVHYETEKCQSCMACVHNCPRKAIQLINGEKNPEARYRHKNITLNEIIEANQTNR